MDSPLLQKPKVALRRWFGCNSAIYPIDLPEGFYQWGVNLLSRGGIPQTRPGMRHLLSVAGKPQGMILFETLEEGRTIMLVAAGGLVYQSEPPFDTLALTDIELSASADFINMEVCIKSFQYDESDGQLQKISPRTVVIIQDGVSRPWAWQSSGVTHLQPGLNKNQTPIMLWMEWVNGRLWGSRGNQIFASDIYDPTSFSEGLYLAEADGFRLEGECTGLIATANNGVLLAFTRKDTTAFQVSVLDRTKWQETTGFQSVILPGSGCVAGRTPINRHGMTWWLSQEGWLAFDSAMQSNRSSAILTRDNEMARSKMKLVVRHRACSGGYGNYSLLAVPAGAGHNRHVWVMDHDAMPGAQEGQEVWQGVWTGVSPVQFASEHVQGEPRIYCLSIIPQSDGTSFGRIWRMFEKRPADDSSHGVDSLIPCQLETKISVPDGSLFRFKFARVKIAELSGEVHMRVFYAGIKGPYVKVLDVNLQAERGSIGSIFQSLIQDDSELQEYRPQVRAVRTIEVSNSADMNESRDGDVTGIESDFARNIDEGFSLLVEWDGRAGIREIEFYLEPVSAEETRGKASAVQDETGRHNAVKFDGSGIPESSLPEEP